MTANETENQLTAALWELEKLKALLKTVEIVALQAEEQPQMVKPDWLPLIEIAASQLNTAFVAFEPVSSFLAKERNEEHKAKHSKQ